MSLKVGITGGASAGHVVPALAVAAELRRLGVHDLVFFGRPVSIENELAVHDGLRFVPVAAAGLRRYRSWRNVTMPLAVVRGVVQAWRAVRRERPDVIFAKGSYVAVPTGVAAWANGIPLVIHESDHSMGLANRILAPLADAVLLSSSNTDLPRRAVRKATVTGLPVRDDLAAGDPMGFRARLGIARAATVLLVFCGSSGSVRINDAIRGQLPRLLERYTIVHVTGRGHHDGQLAGTRGYHQFEYMHDEMVDALWAADVVVGRAGATTLSELAALGKRAIVVPLPASVSRGDQVVNATRFVDGAPGRVVIVDDDDLPTTLPDACIELADLVAPGTSSSPDPDEIRTAGRAVAAKTLESARRRQPVRR